MTPPPTQSSPAWWRIVPKHKAADRFPRKFYNPRDAEELLSVMRRRNSYKVVPYDYTGKRIDA